MIDIKFNISNPWSDIWNILWNKGSMLTKHKAWEFNGYRTNHIVNVEFQFRPVGDHSGARIMLGLLGMCIELHFYDIRHWDYDNDTWEIR